jgi:hypothetical protein
MKTKGEVKDDINNKISEITQKLKELITSKPSVRNVKVLQVGKKK